MERRKGPDDPDLIPALLRRADLALADSDPSAADVDLDRALAIAEESQARPSAAGGEPPAPPRGLLPRPRPASRCARRVPQRPARSAGPAAARTRSATRRPGWRSPAPTPSGGEDLRAWWACRSALAAIVGGPREGPPRHGDRPGGDRAAPRGPVAPREGRAAAEAGAGDPREGRRLRRPRDDRDGPAVRLDRPGRRAGSAAPRRPIAGSSGRSRRGSGPIIPRSAPSPWRWRRPSASRRRNAEARRALPPGPGDLHRGRRPRRPAAGRGRLLARRLLDKLRRPAEAEPRSAWPSTPCTRSTAATTPRRPSPCRTWRRSSASSAAATRPGRWRTASGPCGRAGDPRQSSKIVATAARKPGRCGSASISSSTP